MDEEKSEVSSESMGFKDKAKAMYTLKSLEGRDPNYQFRAVQNYYIRARKILKITKDVTKMKNIGEAMDVFDEWMRDYKENDRGKDNFPYLSIDIVEAFRPLAKFHGILNDDFYTKYKKVDGDYKALRNTLTNDGTTTWDVERNKRLKEMINHDDKDDVKWYEGLYEDDGKGLPTKKHVSFIMLGYSPNPSILRELKKKMTNAPEALPDDDKMEDVEVGTSSNVKREIKRSRKNSSSSESSDDVGETTKKTLKKCKSPVREEKKEEGNALSFKDRERALKSIERLEGRDVCYQYHALAGLIRSAARVISCTKNEEKIKNMKEAVDIFENWITDYKANNRSKENFGYLNLDVVRAYESLAREYGIEVSKFVEAYGRVDGDYKKLRTVKTPNGETTWDIERNKKLRSIIGSIAKNKILWFETDDGKLRGLPTKEHTECIMWGYGVEPAKLKKNISLLDEKLNVAD